MTPTIREFLSRSVGFEWDDGNVLKLRVRHGVDPAKCEEVFSNKPMLLREDEAHSLAEPRWGVLGHSNEGRRLFLVFTPRGERIRVLAARNMNRKERASYAEAEGEDRVQEDPEVRD